jgi:hypothetical protein
MEAWLSTLVAALMTVSAPAAALRRYRDNFIAWQDAFLEAQQARSLDFLLTSLRTSESVSTWTSIEGTV